MNKTQVKLKSKKNRETLVQFAERIRKMGFRGPKDLASNMDRYLYGDMSKDKMKKKKIVK